MQKMERRFSKTLLKMSKKFLSLEEDMNNISCEGKEERERKENDPSISERLGISRSYNGTGCSIEAFELIGMINNYRGSLNLPSVPPSCALCTVAEIKVEQLSLGLASGHNWADCDFKEQPECMWDKPRELTSYGGHGYENYVGGSHGYTMVAEVALDAWKKSPGHNAVIANLGNWSDISWSAIGAALLGEHAVMWIGQEVDPCLPIP